MTLILLYLLVLVLVAGLLFVIASAVFGRGEPLPPLPRATTATALPASGVTGADVDAVKFTQTLRGYKTSEVDWVLDRLSREIELLRGQVSALRALGDEPWAKRDAASRRPSRVGQDDRRRPRPLLVGAERRRSRRAVPRLPRLRVGPATARTGCAVRANLVGGVPKWAVVADDPA